MISKKLGLVAGGACLVALGFAGGLVADDTKHGAGSQAMEEMFKLGQPGPEHAHMAQFAGKWTMNAKMWMEPGAPPMETTGDCTWEMAMDGRYMIEKLDGESMMEGMPAFKGMNVCGYDNISKKYFFAWIDNASTGLFTGWGTSKDGGKTVEYLGECPDCMTGTIKQVKSIVRHVNNDRIEFEMHDKTSEGTWNKTFEAVYTRAK